jgi:hypothetical protein
MGEPLALLACQECGTTFIMVVCNLTSGDVVIYADLVAMYIYSNLRFRPRIPVKRG